jgi:hypothetical protein
MASYHGSNAETYLGLISVPEKVESRNIAMVLYGIEVAGKDLSLKPLTKVGFRFSRERNKQRSQGLSRRGDLSSLPVADIHDPLWRTWAPLPSLRSYFTALDLFKISPQLKAVVHLPTGGKEKKRKNQSDNLSLNAWTSPKLTGQESDDEEMLRFQMLGFQTLKVSDTRVLGMGEALL